MKFLIKQVALVLFFLVSPVAVFVSFGQVLPPASVPIDGGLGFVLAACAAYGAKKLLDKKK